MFHVVFVCPSQRLERGASDWLFSWWDAGICQEVPWVQLLPNGFLLPVTVFEKQGTFINQQFRAQKFLQAVPGINGLPDDLQILSLLLNALNSSNDYTGQIGDVWEKMQKAIPVLSALTFATLPEMGQLLDASAWRDLPFVEGKSLHFDPGTFFKNLSEEKQVTATAG